MARRRRKAAAALLAVLALCGCASEPGGAVGILEFSSPPPGWLRARPARIDGRPVVGGLSRTQFEVEEGIHSVTVIPAEGGPFGEEGPPAVRVSVEVLPGVRHQLAMRRSESGEWEVGSWRDGGP